MHEEVKAALREAIKTAGEQLQPLVGQFKEPHLVWSKHGEQWKGEYRQEPSLLTIFAEARPALDEAGTMLTGVLKCHHAHYDRLVGIPGYQINLIANPSLVLGHVLIRVWNRYKTFCPDGAGVESVVEEFSDFIDQTQVRLRVTAQLLNYRMEVESLCLPEGLAIRRLSEEEVTEIYGGPIIQLGGIGQRGTGIHEFAIVGEYRAEKVFGDKDVTNGSIQDKLHQKFDKAILALRTFKSGRVGYNWIRLEPLGLFPIGRPCFGYGDLYVPFGQYSLSNNELDPLSQHAKLMFVCSEPALKMACSRLADAETRLRPEDQLLDCVIGLEALLLAGVRNEDRRGELKFRFSLNYSTLFNGAEERHRAFRVAKDLYDLRSGVAHGGAAANNHRIGNERLNLQDAATRACGVLRSVVRHFLPQAEQAPYKRHEFWERAYFGL